MVATCDFCDNPAYNTITMFGVKRLRQPGVLLCREHDEEFQEKLVKLVNGYLEKRKSIKNQEKRT